MKIFNVNENPPPIRDTEGFNALKEKLLNIAKDAEKKEAEKNKKSDTTKNAHYWWQDY